MLVDLNLAVEASSFTAVEIDGGGGGGCENRKRGLDFSSSGNNQVESSDSFNSSSVVNVDRNCNNDAAPGDEDSCSNNGGGVFGYSFRILNEEQPARKKVAAVYGDGTIQLFPVGGDGGGVGGGEGSDLRLSFLFFSDVMSRIHGGGRIMGRFHGGGRRKRKKKGLVWVRSWVGLIGLGRKILGWVGRSWVG